MTKDRYQNIISLLRELIKDTPWEGHIYCVGGCCRDEMFGMEIHDIDLAVSLPDGGIKFADWLLERNLLVEEPVRYPMFGTAMMTLKEFPDVDLELVQTRSEKYTDRNSRNPETAFGSIEEDCYRRDFTINSLYYDISRDKVIDITGRGCDDIRNHIIRTPVDADITFDDDPVRILRCVRFASRFGWEIDPATYKSLIKNVDRLSIVSANRMRNEIEKMLIGPRPRMALEMLKDIGAIKHILPELLPLFSLRQYGNPEWSVWEHTLQVVEMVDPVPELRFAALLHDVGKSVTQNSSVLSLRPYDQHESSGLKLVRKIFHRFRFSSALSKEIIYLIVNHLAFRSFGDQGQFAVPKKIRKLQYLSHSRRRFERLLQFAHVNNLAQHSPFCLPEQIPAIRQLISRLDESGTSMYHFSLPFSKEDIRRIKGQISDKMVAKCTDYLLRLAFEKPGRSNTEYEKILRRYNVRSLSSRSSSRKRKK